MTTDTPTRFDNGGAPAGCTCPLCTDAPTRPSTVETVQRLAVLLDTAMNYAARDMREQAQTAADIALQAIKEALEGSALDGNHDQA
jgi:hypothetical protein